MNKKMRCFINTWIYLLLDLVLVYNTIKFIPMAYDLFKATFQDVYLELSFIKIIGRLFILSTSLFLSILLISGSVTFFIKMIQNLFMFHYYLFFNNFENRIDHVYFRTSSDGQVLDSHIVFDNGDSIPVKLDKSVVNIETMVNIPKSDEPEKAKSVE